jgi:hypothetical protein
MLKVAHIVVVLVAALFAAVGCTQLTEYSKRGGKEVGKGVVKYCAEISPEFRGQWRADVNTNAGGNCAVVWCKVRGDPMPDLVEQCALSTPPEPAKTP